MDSIVQELQREAMTSASNISDMLRKSLVVSRKLKIADFESWVNSELTGYKEDLDNIPSYREVKGSLQFFSPYHGWRPVIIQDEKAEINITTHQIAQPITEIEYLLKGEGENLVIQLSQEVQNQLVKWTTGRPTEFRVIFGKSQAQQIIDSVRKIILDWSIQLEEDGIMGEGLNFTIEEKQEATKQGYTVNNFYGPASGVQIQQHTTHSTQTMINELDLDKVSNFVSTLRDNLDKIDLEESNKKKVESAIETISSELSSSKPKSAVIQQSLQTIRNLIEGVTGNLLASGLLHMLGQINI
jgi:AbiTii